MRQSAQKAAGFTILELMVGITVMGVLLGIGVPAFNDIIRNNRTAAQTNELVAALTIARSEATKRGLPVSVCAANTARTACAAADAASWANGWLIYTDRLGTPGTVDTDDEILQTSEPVSGGLGVTSNAVGFVRFGANGALTEAVDITFDVVHDHCTGTNRRQVEVERTGRLNTSKVSCT
jgi:type IV fimbrial biogenesis protein FimT